MTCKMCGRCKRCVADMKLAIAAMAEVERRRELVSRVRVAKPVTLFFSRFESVNVEVSR